MRIVNDMDGNNSFINPELSIVIPVQNEKNNIEPLFREIRDVLTRLAYPYEIIFVDDGSDDGSDKILEKLHLLYPWEIAVATLRRRYGKSMALSAAISVVRGEWILTMDGDGQDAPSEIPKLLEKMKEGFDMVCGWREKRCDPPSKTVPSKLFNWGTRLVSGLPLHDFNCGFKCYKKEVLESISFYGGLYRYLTLLVHQQGFAIAEVSVTHRPRINGRSKYGQLRYVQGFLDLLTAIFVTRFFSRPLHLFGTMGFFLTSVGIVIDGYLTWLWFHGYGIGSRPLLLFGNLLVVIGIQTILMGFIGEMITRFAHTGQLSFPLKRVLKVTHSNPGPIRFPDLKPTGRERT